MLLCSGLTNTSSSMLRSRASTALPGLSRDSWELDSFSLGSPRDLKQRKETNRSADGETGLKLESSISSRGRSLTPRHHRPSSAQQESCNTYEIQPQSQVRGAPQSMPPASPPLDPPADSPSSAQPDRTSPSPPHKQGPGTANRTMPSGRAMATTSAGRASARQQRDGARRRLTTDLPQEGR